MLLKNVLHKSPMARQPVNPLMGHGARAGESATAHAPVHRVAAALNWAAAALHYFRLHPFGVLNISAFFLQ